MTNTVWTTLCCGLILQPSIALVIWLKLDVRLMERISSYQSCSSLSLSPCLSVSLSVESLAERSSTGGSFQEDATGSELPSTSRRACRIRSSRFCRWLFCVSSSSICCWASRNYITWKTDTCQLPYTQQQTPVSYLTHNNRHFSHMPHTR